MTFSSVAEKNWPLSRRYFGSWGHALVAVAVVERFKKESVRDFTIEVFYHFPQTVA